MTRREQPILDDTELQRAVVIFYACGCLYAVEPEARDGRLIVRPCRVDRLPGRIYPGDAAATVEIVGTIQEDVE